jgi:mono/diheme cytochrome c family protein
MAKAFRYLPIYLFCITISILSCGKKEAGQPEQTDSAVVASSTESRVDSELGIRDTVAAVPVDSTPIADTAHITLDPKAEEGKKLYANATVGKIKVSCLSCHATKKDSRLRQGHTLAGVTKRSSTWAGRYKGDALAKNAYGGMLCADLFMLKPGGLKPAEVEVLNAYLATLETASGAITKTLTIQWPAKPPLEKDKFIDAKVAKPFVKDILKLPGDPASGEKLFGRSCASCHDLNADKIGPALKDAAGDADYTVASIRFGSGAMAFYAMDILSDQQIADIVGYIQSKLGQ